MFLRRFIFFIFLVNAVCTYSQADSLKKIEADSISLQEELQAIQPLQTSGNKMALGHVYQNIGRLYFNKKEYPTAVEYFMLSLITCREIEDKTGIATCYQNMANAHKNQHNYAEAIRYYSDAIDMYDELGSRDDEGDCYWDISLIYEIKKNSPQAISNTRKAEALYTFTQNAKKMLQCKERIKQLKTKK